MGVASGSGWNLWVWLVGVVVRRYIDFIILLITTPLFFLQQHPYFFIFYFFYFVLVPVLFVIKFYVLYNFSTQYKHTYGQLRASHGSHMKAAHNVLYMKKHAHTNVHFISCDMDISCTTSRSVV